MKAKKDIKAVSAKKKPNISGKKLEKRKSKAKAIPIIKVNVY